METGGSSKKHVIPPACANDCEVFKTANDLALVYARAQSASNMSVVEGLLKLVDRHCRGPDLEIELPSEQCRHALGASWLINQVAHIDYQRESVELDQ